MALEAALKSRVDFDRLEEGVRNDFPTLQAAGTESGVCRKPCEGQEEATLRLSLFC